MELDGRLPHEAGRAVDLNLDRRQSRAALDRIFGIDHHRGVERHGARLLERDEHIDRLVLERLEGTDRHTELLAGLEIVHCQRVQLLHEADRLGCERGDGAVRHLLNDRKGSPFLAE